MEDLIGMKFGQWTVLERDNNKQYKTRDKRWICKCNCGTTKSVLGKYLKNGRSISCGCSIKKDLSNQRFGKLLVLETLYNYNGNKKTIYHCKCDCGNEVYLGLASLIKQISCGCSRRVDHTGEVYGKLTVVDMLYDYKNGEAYCKCECECGNKNYITRANGLITGNTSSCGCIHSPSLIGERFGIVTVIKEAGSKNNQRLWECKCDCGNIIYRTSHELKRFYSCGCLQNKSSMEAFVKDTLDNNKIEYIQQKRFNDCRDVYSLPFDFYLPQYNLCIEVNGTQHYREQQIFSETLEHRKMIDNIKKEYCKKNNILFLELPYWDFYDRKTTKETYKIKIDNICKLL